MPDNLPTTEAELYEEGDHFIKETVTDPTNFGLTAAQIASLTTKHTAFGNAIQADKDAETTRRQTVADKREKRRVYEAELRSLRQVAQNHPGTTDSDRARLHLATGEGSNDERIGMDEAPLLLVENSGVHAHLIRFYAAGEDSDSTLKPDDALGCVIYLKIDGAASTDLKDYQMITLDTKSPYGYPHDPSNAGKIAHYIGVWQSKDGSRQSQQSEVYSSVVT